MCLPTHSFVQARSSISCESSNNLAQQSPITARIRLRGCGDRAMSRSLRNTQENGLNSK